MEKLSFTLIRKELEVEVTLANNIKKIYKIKEFSGAERESYLDKFDMDISVQDGKAIVQTAKGFKPLKESEFLALCLYDEHDVLVRRDAILTFPSTAIKGLYKAAQELSGFEAEAVEKAKNE